MLAKKYDKLEAAKKFLQSNPLPQKLAAEVASSLRLHESIQNKIDNLHNIKQMMHHDFDKVKSDVTMLIENYYKILNEEALQLSLLPQSSNPDDSKTYDDLIQSIQYLRETYHRITTMLVEQDDFFDPEMKEKLLKTQQECLEKMELGNAKKKLILDKFGTEPQLAEKFNLSNNYPTVWKGGLSQYMGFLCYSDLKSTANVNIKDNDGFVDTENPDRLKTTLLYKEGFTFHGLDLLPSVDTEKIPNKLYVVQHDRLALRYYVYGEDQQISLLGKIHASQLTFSLQKPNDIKSYKLHADEIIEKVFSSIPCKSSFVKLNYFVDDREMDLTLKTKEYKGNEFITGIVAGETILSSQPLDEKDFDVKQIGPSRYVGINKNAPFYKEFKEAIVDKTYLVSPYIAGIHQRHSVVAIKGLKKMRTWFGNELKLDAKEQLASDRKTKKMGYNLFLAQLRRQFTINIVNIPPNEFSCYQEINAILKTFADPFDDADVEPYIKALINAVVLKLYKRENEEIVDKAFKELKNYYKLYPGELEFKTEDMKIKFELTIGAHVHAAILLDAKSQKGSHYSSRYAHFSPPKGQENRAPRPPMPPSNYSLPKVPPSGYVYRKK